MKYIGLKSVLSLVVCTLVVISCTKDKQDQYQDGNMTYLPISDIEVHPLGDVVSVSYTSEGGWEAVIYSEEPDWISFETKGSAGTTYIEIKVEPCLEQDRNATISFVCDGILLDSFDLIQKKAVIDVQESDLNHILKWNKDESNREFTVTSNIHWEVSLNNTSDFAFTSNLNGIQGSVLNGFESQDISVGFKALNTNLSKLERKYAEITITPVKLDVDNKPVVFPDKTIVNSLKKTIRISQDYLMFGLEDNNGYDINANSDYLKNFSELGNYCRESYPNETTLMPETDFSRVFNVMLEEGYNWKDNLDALEREGYISVSRHSNSPRPNKDDPTRNEVETVITLTWEKPNHNNTEVSKELRFWIVDESGKAIEGAELTIPMTQKPYEFDLSYDSLSGMPSYRKTISNQGETVHFNLNTSGPWSFVGNVPGWMQISPESGFGDTKVTVTVADQNLQFKPKSYSEGQLKIASGLNDINIPINIDQSAFRFNVEYKDSTPEKGISRMDTNPYEVIVTSDGPWSLELEDVKSSEPWLTVQGVSKVEEGGKVKYSGEACEDLSISFFAAEYNTTSTSPDDDRSKSLKFKSTLHDENVWGKEGEHIKRLSFIQQSLRTKILDSNRENDFKVSPTFAAYKSAGMKEGFFINCSAPWKLFATSGNRTAEWIHFEDSDGNIVTEGDGKEYMPITMLVATNTDDTSRRADVKVVVTVGGSSTEISLGTLTQDGFVFDVTSDQISEFEALNNKSVTISISSTPEAEWTVSCDEWIRSETKSGSGDKIVHFTPEYNSESYRSGGVKITSSVSGASKEFFFKQKGYEFSGSEETLSLFDEIASNAKSQNVYVRCTGEWRIDNVPNWMNITLDGASVSEGKGNQTLVFSVSSTNASLEERNATIYVKSKDFPDKHIKPINVRQAKYTWNVTGMDNTISREELYDKTVEVAVTSSGDWTAEIETDQKGFVSISPDKGTGNKYKKSNVNIRFSANYTKEPRTAKLTIRSKDYNNGDGKNLIKSVDLEQDAYIFDAPVENLTYDAAGGETKIEGFKCSGDFNVSKLPDWLEVNIKSGVLTVSAKENTGKDRSHTVTIESEHVSKNGDLKAVFEVSQSAAQSGK